MESGNLKIGQARDLNPRPYTVTLDDDPVVSKLIESASGLPSVGFGQAGPLLEAQGLAPLALFVDIHLDAESGLDAVPALRRRWPFCPIIVITADPDDQALAQALSLGADDFIMKPLRPREVRARLQARLSDQALKQSRQTLTHEDIRLDLLHRVLVGPKGQRFLSPTETNLLATLLQSGGSTVERACLKHRCWDQVCVSDNALDRKVFEVRKALTDVGSCLCIGTTYGVGFFINCPKPSGQEVGALR